MNKIIALTKVMMIENSMFEFYSEKLKRKSFFKIILTLLFGVFFISLFCYAISGGYDILTSIEQRKILLVLGLFLSSIVVFINGLFFSLSIFFYSNDGKYLLAIPIHNVTIIISKFLIVLLNSYLVETIITMPFILVFGVRGNGDLLFWCISFLIFLMLPVIPLVVGTLIVFYILRFLPYAKNKDIFKIYGGLITIGIGIVIQLLIKGIINSGLEGMLKIFNNNDLILKIINPIVILGVNALTSDYKLHHIIFFLQSLVICVVVLISVIWIGNRSYIKGYQTLSEAYIGTNNKLIRCSDKSLFYKESQLIALLKREMRTLFRTPEYFLNCIVPNLIYPLLLGFVYFSSMFNELIVYLKLNIYTEYFVIFGFCGVIFQSSLNVTSTTSLSREGKDFFILKYIPINYKTYLNVKLIISLCIGFINLFINIIILIISGIPFNIIKFLILPSLMAVIFTNELGIIIDIFLPKMDWINEWQIFRKNLTPIVFNIICTILASLVGYIMYYLHLNIYLSSTLLTILFGMLNILLYNFIYISKNKLFELND